jgi:hypothetical protein
MPFLGDVVKNDNVDISIDTNGTFADLETRLGRA